MLWSYFFLFLLPQVDFFLGFFFAEQPQDLHMVSASFRFGSKGPELPRPLGIAHYRAVGGGVKGKRGRARKK